MDCLLVQRTIKGRRPVSCCSPLVELEFKRNRYKRLRAYFAILAGVLFPGSSLREDELKPYLITPLPAANPFVAKALSEPAAKTDLNRLMSRDNNTRKIPARRLVLHLLRARAEAVNSVSQLFGKIG